MKIKDNKAVQSSWMERDRAVKALNVYRDTNQRLYVECGSTTLNGNSASHAYCVCPTVINVIRLTIVAQLEKNLYELELELHALGVHTNDGND